ncbi:MAG TPA: hypothetical protein PLV12_11790, partial [Saprospiraceae bacterium]|nr:hypothetical protein [Saprospiraceae bacterium]
NQPFGHSAAPSPAPYTSQLALGQVLGFIADSGLVSTRKLRVYYTINLLNILIFPLNKNQNILLFV